MNEWMSYLAKDLNNNDWLTMDVKEEDKVEEKFQGQIPKEEEGNITTYYKSLM